MLGLVGACGVMLASASDAVAAPMEVDEDAFNDLVTRSSNLVVVDFSAEWCRSCKALEPVIRQIARTHADVTFAKVDVDRNSDLADYFKVQVLPTIVFIRDGKVVDGFAGPPSLRKFDKVIRKHK